MSGARRGVVRQGAGPARRGDAADLGVASTEGGQLVGPVASDQDLRSGSVAATRAGPCVSGVLAGSAPAG
ncbi:hypothetical protein [Methylobacterium sp. PvR107]|uniref:hypothetical protein n=1 Tax=Methylobacterium sp. PvR107 TaxID=2806597 RepID=UPI001AE532F9|nr:hypothetical protein [Methylobacterium sp. PvR107]MBP1181384.1 hypothetical protein [Methylobacterium sp. PvR107]